MARLPRHSHYRAAIDDDDELASVAIGLAEQVPSGISLAGYSDVVARLDNVFDAIMAVQETLVAIHSTTRPRPQRAPRPTTAYQRHIEAAKRQRLDSIVHRMTGGR